MAGTWMLGVNNGGRYVCVVKVHTCVHALMKAFKWMGVMWSMQAGHLIHHKLTQILVPSAAGLKGLAEKCSSLQLAVCTKKTVLQLREGNSHGILDGFRAYHYLNIQSERVFLLCVLERQEIYFSGIKGLCIVFCFFFFGRAQESDCHFLDV